MFLCEKTHVDISRTIIDFFDALKTKYCKITGNYNLLTKVKFHELEFSFNCPQVLLQTVFRDIRFGYYFNFSHV